MLACLSIRDFALISELTFAPGRGFVALTGETGAGKSILIDALACLLGERADTRQIRTGSDRALLEAVFVLDSGEEVTLCREILSNGRSLSRIDGNVVPLSHLRELGESLAAIHGQRESLRIFRESTHRDLLDSYAGRHLSPFLSAYEMLRARRIELDSIFSGQEIDPEVRRRRLDLLRFQTEEIASANLSPGEEKTLRDRQKRLNALLSLSCDVASALDSLRGERSDVMSFLNRATAQLARPARISKAIAGSRDRLLELAAQIEEEISKLSHLFERLETDPAEVEDVEMRLEQIGRLTYKYGGSIENVLEYEKQALAELAEDSTLAVQREEWQKESAVLDERLEEADGLLHNARVEAATALALAIEDELTDLGMKKVRFEIEVTRGRRSFAAAENGRDLVRFLISPNPGEPLLPLAKIASGGEAARVLLAIKSILAAVDDLDVLIFDEIDAGVSGKTSMAIGKKLRELGRIRQVFAVTHSAPIAALADELFVVAKHEESGRMVTTVRKTDYEEKISEVARLLSGQPEDASAQELAGRLIAGGKDR